MGARPGFGGLAGRICGRVALALAIVAIFVPINGILISCVASALVASFHGEFAEHSHSYAAPGGLRVGW